MIPETALRSTLLASTSVTNVIDQRYYPMNADQGKTLPRIVYFQSDRDSEASLAGKSSACETFLTLEIHCSKRDYDTCNALCKVINNLVNYPDDLPRFWGDLWVMRSKFTEDIQETEENIPGQDEKCIVFKIEVSLYHEEP